jgi:exopolysaccharide biosynthesis protein
MGAGDILCKIVRPRKCLVAIRANIGPLLSVCSNMSKRRTSVAAINVRDMQKITAEPHRHVRVGAGG